jgi:hypothetical protein
MAGHTLSKLRIFDLRQQAAPSEHEARPLHIDFGPFDQAERTNVVLIGAVAAFMVGLALWGFLTLSILAGVDDLMGEGGSSPTATEAAETEVFNCANFGAVRALSAEDEARLQAQCGASLPVSGPAAVPVSTALEAPDASSATAGNRANCEQIRGTDYRSNGERTWFLANCIAR